MRVTAYLLLFTILWIAHAFSFEKVENIPRNMYPVRVGYVDRVGEFYPV